MIPLIEKDNPVNNTPYIVYLLIGINTIIFFLTKHYFSFEDSMNTYAFIPSEASISTASSSMFMHIGLAHLIANMFFLYIFGDNVEDVLGKIIFLFVYLLCGVLSVFAFYVVNLDSVTPLVGASGAISGVLGIYMVLFPHTHFDLSLDDNKTLAHITAKQAILIWLLVQAIFGLITIDKTGGIAFSAHIGGILAGFVIGYILKVWFNFAPLPPQRMLRFQRDRVSDIWCPHCGYKENSKNFGIYKCKECDTEYLIEKSKYYNDLDNKIKEKSIDLKPKFITQENTPTFQTVSNDYIPNNAKYSARLSSINEGIEVEYEAYLEEIRNDLIITIVVNYDGKYELLDKKQFKNTGDLSEYLEHSTKFRLTDFA